MYIRFTDFRLGKVGKCNFASIDKFFIFLRNIFILIIELTKENVISKTGAFGMTSYPSIISLELVVTSSGKHIFTCFCRMFIKTFQDSNNF